MDKNVFSASWISGLDKVFYWMWNENEVVSVSIEWIENKTVRKLCNAKWQVEIHAAFEKDEVLQVLTPSEHSWALFHTEYQLT